MTRYLLARIPSAVAVVVVASFFIFWLIRLVPGNPAVTLAGPGASPETIAAIKAELGLNGPLLSQYLSWVSDIFRGDLGESYRLGGEVSELIADAAVNTLVLTTTALLLAIIIALVLGCASVISDRGWVGSVVTAFSSMAMAVPTFVTGLLLVLVFAVLFPVLPAGGVPPEGLLTRPGILVQYLLLPAVSLALPCSAVLTRFVTESLSSEMRQPYVTTALAVGVSRRRVVLTQALPNALPPAVTVVGLQFGVLLGGAVLVEAIFFWPGLGLLIQQAISSRDYPVVQALLLLSVVVFVTVQLVTDVMHAWLDPRIRLGGAK